MSKLATAGGAPSAGELSIIAARPDYALLPVTDGFDWQAIIRDVKETRAVADAPLYLVAFRSLLKATANRQALAEHDHSAHLAALESPALIHYFADTANENGQALSFCLWENAAIAKTLSRDPRHRAATALVSEYDAYSIAMYDVHHNEDPVRFELRAEHQIGQFTA